MKLTELQCKNAKPIEKVYKLTDGGGLVLLIKPNGGKYWQLYYRLVHHKLQSGKAYI